MVGLTIVDTIYFVIGLTILVALYNIIRSGERWIQVRMIGLILVCLMVLIPLLLLRCNKDVLGEEVEITDEPMHYADIEIDGGFGIHFPDKVYEKNYYTKNEISDGKFEVRFNLIPVGSRPIREFRVVCTMVNDAKILSFKVMGEDKELLWNVKKRDDGRQL